MRVRVNDKARLRDLIRYLRDGGCIAEQAGPKTLDVFVPSASNEREARMELGIYLTAWRIRNPGVEAELMRPRRRPFASRGAPSGAPAVDRTEA